MKKNSLTLEWRGTLRHALVVLWIIVFLSQIILYTSVAEIIIYILLDLVLVFIFLRFAQLNRSPYRLVGTILIISFILGLVPYKIRLGDLTLFFFQSAKDETVTYYVDPYMNLGALVFDLVFPFAHFVLMYAITKTYSRSTKGVSA